MRRIDHLDLGAVGLDEAAQREGHLQVDVLLLAHLAHGTRIVAAMARVDDEGKRFLAAIERLSPHGHGRKQDNDGEEQAQHAAGERTQYSQHNGHKGKKIF